MYLVEGDVCRALAVYRAVAAQGDTGGFGRHGKQACTLARAGGDDERVGHRRTHYHDFFAVQQPAACVGSAGGVNRVQRVPAATFKAGKRQLGRPFQHAAQDALALCGRTSFGHQTTGQANVVQHGLDHEGFAKGFHRRH